MKFAGLALAAVVLAGCSTTKQAPGPTVTITKNVPSVVPFPSTETVEVTATVTVVRTRVQVRTVAPKDGPATGGITYRVTADSGEANSITYSNGGSIEQATNVSLPWSKTVSGDSTVDQVSAQNSGGGTITCEIVGPDGYDLSKHSSSGQYAVVSCNDG